jgi:hypothetical protein
LRRRTRRIDLILGLVGGFLLGATQATPLPPAEDLDRSAKESEQLLHACEVLARASEVSLSELLPVNEYEPRALLREWERLQPAALVPIIESRANDLGRYARLTAEPDRVLREAVPLLAPLVDYDPDRLESVLSRLSETAGFEDRGIVLNRAVKERLVVLGRERSPDETASLLDSVKSRFEEFDMDFAVRGVMVDRFRMLERREEARRTAEDMIADFKTRRVAGFLRLADFGEGIFWFRRFSPDLFEQAFGLLDDRLNEERGEGPDVAVLGNDGSAVRVGRADWIRLKALGGQGPGGPSPVVRSVLSDRPDLRRLVERVNFRVVREYTTPLPHAAPRDQATESEGERLVRTLADRSRRAFQGSSGPVESMNSSINLSNDGSAATTGVGPPRPNSLGAGIARPSWRRVRSDLDRRLGRPDRFEWLFRYAATCGGAGSLPEQCCDYALTIALRLLSEADEPLLKARLLSGILPLERRMKGRLDEARLAAARGLLVDLRSEPPESATDAAGEGIGLAIDRFERIVVAEWAHHDYSAATAFAENLSGFDRYAVFLEMARSLSQSPFYGSWP